MSDATGSSSKQFSGVQVFSATLAEQRGRLGEQVTKWIAAHPTVEIADVVVTQSSDRSFHCLTITLFVRERQRERRSPAESAR